jgi:hypothetical protein
MYPLHLLSIICNYKSWNTCFNLVVTMIVREVDCAQLDEAHNYMSNFWIITKSPKNGCWVSTQMF